MNTRLVIVLGLAVSSPGRNELGRGSGKKWWAHVQFPGG